jgi:hypothetical protein
MDGIYPELEINTRNKHNTKKNGDTEMITFGKNK